MVRAFLFVLVANVLAIGVDAILRNFLSLHVPHQSWICLNLAWVAVLMFNKGNSRW